MKKNIVSFAFVLTLFMTSVMFGSDYIIETAYVRGPIRSNPEWKDWASGVVMRAYENQGFGTDNIGYSLLADYISQPAPYKDSQTLWLAVRIVCRNNAKVSLRQLQFEQHSNDGDSLASSYKPADANTVYSPTTLGVNWNGPVPRANDTIVPDGTTGLSQVDEIIFIGMQSPFYTYPVGNYQTVADIQRYLSSFPDFRIQGIVKIVDDGQVLATSFRSMYASKRQPISPRFSINRVGKDISFTLDLGPEDQTLFIESATDVKGVWTIEDNINPGANILFPANTGTKFFRAVFR